MPFVSGRGFAEVQIRKKWNWPYLLNRLEYFDKILHTHWCWQTLAEGIAECNFSVVGALPMSNFETKWNRPLLLNRV